MNYESVVCIKACENSKYDIDGIELIDLDLDLRALWYICASASVTSCKQRK